MEASVDIPRISVLMITYNQEKLVGRALDSLIRQKEFIYEICINDDCSKDNTWDVIQEYAAKHPDLIKPIRNEQNLGIFQNIEATWKRPTGDIIYRLAGDDECGEGYFEAVIAFIRENRIDVRNELFCIYGDYVQKFPDGNTILYKQHAAKKKVPPIRLKLRGLVNNRSACYSINILHKFKNVSDGRSYSVESVQDSQLAMFTEKNYYIPIVGNIYYAAIGVSVNSKDNIKDRGQEMKNKLFSFMKDEGINIDPKDIEFLNFRTNLIMGLKTASFRCLMRAMKHYFNSWDFRLGWDTFYFKEIINMAKRRRYY